MKSGCRKRWCIHMRLKRKLVYRILTNNAQVLYYHKQRQSEEYERSMAQIARSEQPGGQVEAHVSQGIDRFNVATRLNCGGLVFIWVAGRSSRRSTRPKAMA